MTMPVYKLDAFCVGCDAQENEIVRAAFTNRGVKNKSDGYAKLRSSKPFKRVATFEQGCANYVWRMLCFDLVGSGKHACMPVCADFEICEALEARDGDRAKYGDPRRRELMDRMDELTKKVERNIPVTDMKGIIRWGCALGMI